MMIRSNAKNKFGLLRLLMMGLGLLTVQATTTASADTHSYASERKQIRACVLVTNAAPGKGGPQNLTPHVFYVMDRRTDLKPAGWEFVNPQASTTISGDIYTRWLARANAETNPDPAFANTPAGVAFRVGQPLTKNFGAYWEVNLDSSGTDLSQFDIVLMDYRYGQTVLTPDEREKLRHFVDGGGTIWLEDEGGLDFLSGGSYGAGQFIVDLGFASAIPANSTPIATTQHHPLINFPYALTGVDIRSLGAAGVQYDVNGAHHAHQGVNNTFTAVNGIANPRVLVPIILTNSASGQLPYISAGDYGAGHILVSSGGIATGINSYVGGFDVGEGGNSAVTSGDTMLGARPVDLKFAYNLVAWTSSVPTAGSNVRRTSSSREDVGALLGNRFAAIPPATTLNSVGSGAVIHKGVIFFVDGNNFLHAYDASPQQDLDNDQNPDDGIIDLIYGAPYDEIWKRDLTNLPNCGSFTRFSTPTIASIVNPATGAPQDLVIVTSSTGTTVAFDAFPTSGGVLATTSPTIWQIVSTDSADLRSDLSPAVAVGNTLQAPSPAFSDGVLFTAWQANASDANHPWHIAAIDPLTGNEIFHESATIGDSVAPSALPAGTFTGGAVAGIPNIVGSPSVGYVRDDSTGALDKMIYVPTRTTLLPTKDSGAGTVHGVWFSTKGEPLETVQPPTLPLTFSPTGRRKNVPWYLTAPPANGVDLRPVLYRNRAGVLTRLRYNVDFTVQYTGASGGLNDIVVTIPSALDGDTYTADYTLDWPGDVIPIPAGSARPTVGEMNLFSQRIVQFTPNTLQGSAPPNSIHLFGSPALSSQDYLFAGLGDYPGGDRLYAFHEQFGSARGVPSSPKLAWMFYANAPDDDFNIGAGGVQGRFHNADPFFPPAVVQSGTLPALPDVYVTDFEQTGSPAYADGIVYITGYCHLRTDQNSAAQALPDAAVVVALRAHPNTDFQVTDGGNVVNLNNHTVTVQQPDLVNSTALIKSWIVLKENVNFTLDRVSNTIHIYDFKSKDGVGDAINTALPIQVGIDGEVEPRYGPYLNPQTGYGILDNVLWWMTVPLKFNANFYPGLPYPAQWSGSNPGGASGLQPASGPTILGNTLYYGSTTGQIVSVDISGANSGGGQLNVYKTDGTSRVNAQAAMKDVTGPNVGFAVQQPIFSPPVATTGIVAVGTPAGISVFDNQLTLIADNNRVLEVDNAGRAAWTTDATQSIRLAQSQGANGNNIASLKTALSRPNMAHRYTLNDYLIADTGNNRVIEMDHGGIVTWELSKVNNDLRFLRENDPLVLNQPTDIQTYTTSGTGSLTFTSPISGQVFTYNPGAGGLWFAIHYIIADSGNFRALEVVDIYDVNGDPVVMNGVTMLRQVVFATRSYGEQNQAFRYRTIQQFANIESGVFNTYMVAAVDNVRQAADLNPAATNVGTNPVNVKGPGSSLVILKRYPATGKDGDTAALINSIVYPNPSGPPQRQTISNPRWFKEFNVENPANPALPLLHYALADENGVYVLVPGTGALKGEAVVEWSLSNDDYYYMTGRHLHANSIQKLAASDYDPGTNKFYPHYLITNGYTGRDNIFEIFGGNIIDGEIHGEVVEVRSDYYFTKPGGYRNAIARLYAPSPAPNPGGLIANPSSAITWMVPNETIPAPPPSGAGVIVRKIGVGANGTSTGLLEQPTFSDRPF